VFWSTIVCLQVIFLLDIVLVVFLQFMVSDSTFGTCILKVEVITLNTFYSHHYDFVNRYTVYVSQVTTYICSVCRNHNTVLTLFMSYHRLCNKSNTTGATSGAGTNYTSAASVFCGVRVSCAAFCKSLFVLLSFLSFLF